MAIGGNRVIALLSEAMLDWLFQCRREWLRNISADESGIGH